MENYSNPNTDNKLSTETIMGLRHRQPLQEIQEESNSASFLYPQNGVPRVTITTSPITASELENKNNDKLPTLTTPPQTVTRSVSNSATRQQDQDSSFTLVKSYNKPRKLKKAKSTTLLSPAFSSPPTKAEKSASLPPPPELPKFVTSNITKAKINNKKERTQEDIDELNRQVPPPELMPQVIDTSTDFTKKPAYSYAMLIGMSILRAPNRRLTLSQIYNWISDTFKYYKKGDVGWQNSVRHNLSLNKAFVKSAKSKDRKGHFWHIAKGYEYQFYLGKGASGPVGAVPAGKMESFKLNSAPMESVLEKEKLSKRYSDSSFVYQNNTENQASDEEENQDDDDDDEDQNDDEEEYEDDDDRNEDDDATVRINNVTLTPRSKIIGRDYNEQFMTAKESSTALQKYVLHKRTSSQDDSSLLPPTKRRVLPPPSSTGFGMLASNNIPNLQPPSPYWSASASGDKVIFGILRTPPKMPSHSSTSNTTSQSSIFDSPLQLQQQTHPSSVHQDNRYQQFTSSFSCTSNFDLSPIKGTETGPLLEPLTPGQGLLKPVKNNNHMINPSTPSVLKTPFNKNNLTMKTPGSSVMKKIWNSPSYLDDFYTSPVVNRGGMHFEEEEVVVSSTRSLGSPSKASKNGGFENLK